MMYIPVLAFVVTLAMLFLLLRTGLSRLALDQPNHRSLHTAPIPRTGGLSIMTGILAAGLFLHDTLLWMIILALLLVFVSLTDDVRPLPVRWRLLVHLAISSYLAWLTLPLVSWGLLVLAILGLTWAMNLYNFMDGSDGLAGGMAVFGFSSYAVTAWMGGSVEITAMSTAIAAASLAFLLFNFHPARIFMGDSGSVPLGFFAGAIGIYGWQLDLWPFWFPLLTFSPFIVDATVTLVKRVIKKERFWQAHKDHYYQRLIRLGWGHRRVALAEYALMMAVAVSGVLLINQSSDLISLALASWLIIYVILMHMIDKKWCLHSTAIQ